MGAWGYGIYDNDTAMDANSDIIDMMNNGFGIQKCYKHLINHYGNDTDFLFVIIDKCLRYGLPIPSDINVNRVLLHALSEACGYKNKSERTKIIYELSDKVNKHIKQ